MNLHWHHSTASCSSGMSHWVIPSACKPLTFCDESQALGIKPGWKTECAESTSDGQAPTLGISNCWAHYKHGIGKVLQSSLLLILTEFKTQSCEGYSVTFTISRVINFGIQELIDWRGITKKHFAHRAAHRKPFFLSDNFKDIFMESLSCLEKFIYIQDFGRTKGWISGTCDAAVLCTLTSCKYCCSCPREQQECRDVANLCWHAPGFLKIWNYSFLHKRSLLGAFSQQQHPTVPT